VKWIAEPHFRNLEGSEHGNLACNLLSNLGCVLSWECLVWEQADYFNLFAKHVF
jgi:hypothetical protein